MKTATVNARVEPKLKEDAEKVLKHLGITTTQAITMFFQQIKVTRSLPLDLKLPQYLDIELVSKDEDDYKLIEKTRVEASVSLDEFMSA